MTACAFVHSHNFPRPVSQYGTAPQERGGGHYATENRDQCAISLDASDDPDQSVSYIFHRPEVSNEVFGHTDAIEELLAHFHSPAFQLRNSKYISVGLATLNSLLGCLLHVGKMACVTTASRFQSCEQLASVNSRRRDSGNQNKSQLIIAGRAA